MDIKKKIANLTRGEIELLEGAIFYTPEEIKFGWYYLQIKGDSYKRGFQHGFFLGSEIRDHIDRNFRALWFMTGNESSFYCEAARRLWLDKIDDEFLTELQGIVDGTACRGRLENKEIAVTLPEILAWNGLYELFMSWLPLESISTSKNFIPRKNQKSCTAFIATGEATKGHHTVMAHTTWDAYHIEAPHKLILDIFPEKGHPFHAEFSSVFEELETRLSKDPTLHYDFDYDQIVPFGEMISTRIISACVLIIPIFHNPVGRLGRKT